MAFCFVAWFDFCFTLGFNDPDTLDFAVGFEQLEKVRTQLVGCLFLVPRGWFPCLQRCAPFASNEAVPACNAWALDRARAAIILSIPLAG